MSRAAIVSLLSGFVLPGLGQIHLRKYLRGLAIMLFVTAGLVVLVGAAAVAAADYLQEVLRRGGTIDIQTIVQLVLNASPSGRLCYRIIFF